MKLETVQKLLKDAVGHRNKWRAEAKKDYDFVAGEQWSPEERQVMEDLMRPVTVFNRIGPIVDAIVGHEAANRQSVAYMPRQLGATNVAESISAAARWVRDECGADGEESDAFEDAVITGEGWTDTRVDYEEDIDGKIIIEKVDPREMDIDPSSQKKNYEDAKWKCRTRKMDRARAQELWPKGNFAPTSRRGGDEPIDVIAAAFYHLDSGAEGRSGENANLVLIHDFQWWELEKVLRVPAQMLQMVFMVHPELAPAIAQTMPDAKPSETGLCTFTPEEWETIKDYFPGVKPVEQRRKVYWRLFWSGMEELERKKTPTADSFTYKAITAKRDRQKRFWYGLVRPMRDPQLWSNKFMSLALENIGTSAKGGIMAEMDAFQDPRKAEDDWADPAKLIYLKPGALSGPKAKVAPRPFTPMPPGSFELMRYADQSINDVAGVNPAVMGFSKELDVSGVLEQTRLQAGLNLLSYLFDGLRRYRKEQGVLLMKMIREYIPEGRLVKIEGQEGAQYVKLAFNPEVAKYDIVVDEAPTAPNVKEQTWETITALAKTLPPPLMQSLFPPQVMATVLKFLPLPGALVQEITKQLAKPNPMAQQMQHAQLGEAVGRARELNAKADKAEAEAKHVGQTDPLELAGDVMKFRTEELKARAEVTAADAKVRQTHLEMHEAQLHHHLDTQAALRDAALAEHQAHLAAQQPKQPTGNA